MFYSLKIRICAYRDGSDAPPVEFMEAGEPVPELARAQDQIVKLVLRGVFVPQKEADHETHL
jgi:hypothetical protein